MKIGFVESVHVQWTTIFLEAAYKKKKEKKTYATNISI